MSKNRSFVEKYIARKIERPYSEGFREVFSVSQDEFQQIKKVRFYGVLYAALTGALAVLVLYVPYYLFPSLFPDSEIWLPGVNDYYMFPVVFTLYSLLLLIIELIILTVINASVVKGIAHACHYPNPENKHYDSDVNALIAVGLDRKIKDQQHLGINPYLGLAKWQLFLFTALSLAKATLTNFIFKLLIKRLLGRFALRIVMDLAGVPVYAFWNAWATNKVAKETKIRVMASPLIKKTVKDLKNEFGNNEFFARDLYNMLDFIAISKRSFHYNHYLFSILLLEEFGVEIDPEREYDSDFLKRIALADEMVKKGFEKVVILGMIIDGKISIREQKAINHLRNSKLIQITDQEIEQKICDFLSANIS